MTIDASQLSTHWRRCSLTADFWSRYIALFAPPSTPPGILCRDDVESVLAYLLNELFENVAKFSGGPVQTGYYRVWVLKEQLIFEITNHIEAQKQQPFIELIQEIFENDPDELYFKKLEENVELDQDESGLGYLTLIKDYNVRFAFCFQPAAHFEKTESVAVTIQARVSLKEEQ